MMQVGFDNSWREAPPPSRPVSGMEKANEPFGVDVAVDGAVAFNALMASLRASGFVMTKQHPAASPNQMFEPNAGSSHETRMNALKAQDQDSRALGSESQRPGSSGVAARRAEGEHSMRGEAYGDRDVRARIGNDSENTKPVISRNDAARSDPSFGREGRVGSRAGLFDPRTAQQTGGSLGQAATLRSSSASDGASLDPSKGSIANASVVTSSSAGLGVAQGQRASGVSVADRIAEVLTTSRPDDGNTARAQTAGSTTLGGKGNDPHTARTNPSGAQAETGGGSKPAPGARVNAPTDFAELVKSIRLHAGMRRSSARLQLDPPELGRVTVDVQMKDNELKISVRTESDEASSVLRQRADTLRAALEHFGIHIERFDIETNAERGGAAGQAADDGKSSPSFSERSPGFEDSVDSRERHSKNGEAESADPVPDMEWHGVGAARLDIRV